MLRYATTRSAACSLLLATLAAGPSLAAATESDPANETFVGSVHIDDASLPRPSRTPGDVLPKTKVKDLCAEGAVPASRLPPSAQCDTAFSDYGIPADRRFQYECRYLVPLSIGGASTVRNVWPQVASEARLKDALDRDVTKRVCSNEISPSNAQDEIRADWVSAYRKYLIPGDPAPVVMAPPPETPRVKEGAVAPASDRGQVGVGQVAADALAAGGGTDPTGQAMPQGGYPDMPPMSPQSSSPRANSSQTGPQSQNGNRQQDQRRSGRSGESRPTLSHLPRNAPMRPIPNARPATAQRPATTGRAPLAARANASRPSAHRGMGPNGR